VAYLLQFLIQSKKNYRIFNKELLAIVAAIKEWRHYLEGNTHRLKAIVYTNHQYLESFMQTKKLTQRQACWAETLGCFDFEIVFCPGHHLLRLDTLSHQPNLAPETEDNLMFGSLLRPDNISEETFAEVAFFESWFEDKKVDLKDAKHWFQVDVLGVGEPKT
jgi:hypothetical protein